MRDRAHLCRIGVGGLFLVMNVFKNGGCLLEA
jgi:hypothetical protein